MPELNRPRARRKADSTTHHEPYPARLHRHLSAAVDAAALTVAPPSPSEAQPTPDALLKAYGGNGEVNASQSEGGENAGSN